jgi:hypothetical protein
VFERSEFLATLQKSDIIVNSDKPGCLFLWFCFFWANKRNERPAAAKSNQLLISKLKNNHITTKPKTPQKKKQISL